MAKFTDANDLEWMVFIDIPTVKLLRQHDLDVLGLFDEGFTGLEKLLGDPVRLVDTISLICQDQIKEREMDEVKFAKSLWGDALQRAVDALIEGITDFFHDPKRRESIKAVFRKSRQLESMMYDQAAAQIEAMDLNEAMKALQTELSEQHTKSGASSV